MPGEESASQQPATRFRDITGRSGAACPTQSAIGFPNRPVMKFLANSVQLTVSALILLILSLSFVRADSSMLHEAQCISGTPWNFQTVTTQEQGGTTEEEEEEDPEC